MPLSLSLESSLDFRSSKLYSLNVFYCEVINDASLICIGFRENGSLYHFAISIQVVRFNKFESTFQIIAEADAKILRE